MTEVKNSLTSFDPNTSSVIHLKIRRMKKNFENFKEFLKNLNANFSALCLSETLYESQDESRNSNYILSGYNCFHQYSKYHRGEGVCLFLRKWFCYKTKQDLSINCDAIESLCLGITNKKSN